MMRKILAVVGCLAVAGCDNAGWFEKGDRARADVVKEHGDPCVIQIFMASATRGKDLAFRARLETPDCRKQ